VGYERIGFANRNADGTWSPIFNTDAKARRAAREGGTTGRDDWRWLSVRHILGRRGTVAG
jgi:hypothetical protein